MHLSPRDNNRASAPFELVHFDVWGPCPVVSPTGFRYFVTFFDDYLRTTWLYLMKNRSELFSHFPTFCVEIDTQFHVFVQNLEPFGSFKGGLFALEASWGRVLTLYQLKKRGRPLTNRCFLCEKEETLNHLLVHCPRAKIL